MLMTKNNQVRTWLNTTFNSPDPTTETCLQVAFKNSLKVSTNPDKYFFDSIYIPVKTPTAQGMPEDFTYTRIGFNIEDIAEIYGETYLGNYLIDPCILIGGIHNPAVNQLSRRIKAVFNLNKQKYLKLIELQGYSYNPLWNVDGTEEYAFLENQGINDVKTTTNLGNITGKTNTYDGTLKDATQTTYGNATSGGNNNTSTEYTHNNAKNNGNVDYNAGTDVWNNNVIGGDKYHTEKRVHQGNIGVTKTQELIASERENLRFTVLQEFFDDINKQILIGIFDN